MPGVLKVEILKEILKQPFPEHEIRDIASVKFMKPVRPYEQIMLEYEINLKEDEDGILKVNAEGRHNEAVFVKVQMKLAKR
jgi:3-hydroxymyristoyl/3-hydroxydecanoyl-(acyl carrier protein) dehydratase